MISRIIEGGNIYEKEAQKITYHSFVCYHDLLTPDLSISSHQKDVTKTYRKSVTKMLEGFDSYFAYCCGRRQYFKFDDYARTTMVTMKNYNLWEKNISYVKKKIQPQLKLYFNTSTVKFTKFTKYGIPRNPSYLLCNKNGKIVYTGGNWGEDSPNGVVKKIMKTGSKTYESNI